MNERAIWFRLWGELIPSWTSFFGISFQNVRNVTSFFDISKLGNVLLNRGLPTREYELRLSLMRVPMLHSGRNCVFPGNTIRWHRARDRFHESTCC
ncbi:hypothetical protein RRSWK_02625 [Rhodopirellula sp. SWK7]|nr:hypothetical protein RRSWK_02625 [Rhodopirellula sp. SWK7]